MTAAMHARGPDGINHWRKGNVAPGQCMLRTTPESLEETQPLTNEDHSLALVMDGDRIVLDAEKGTLDILVDPGVLALDEPSGSLDPRGRRELLALLRAVAEFLQQEGFRVIGAQEVLDALTAVQGVYGRTQPTARDEEDIAIAFRAAKTLGALDIGQAVIELGGVIDYFIDNSFNYPTLAEGYKVAALDAWNRLRHREGAVIAFKGRARA